MQLALIKLLSESSTTTAIIPCSTSLVHTTRTASDNSWGGLGMRLILTLCVSVPNCQLLPHYLTTWRKIKTGIIIQKLWSQQSWQYDDWSRRWRTFANNCSLIELCFFASALIKSSLPWEEGRVWEGVRVWDEGRVLEDSVEGADEAWAEVEARNWVCKKKEKRKT